jgi:hypothetical protein
VHDSFFLSLSLSPLSLSACFFDDELIFGLIFVLQVPAAMEGASQHAHYYEHGMRVVLGTMT